MKKRLFFVMGFLLPVLSGFAQEKQSGKTITGKVLSAEAHEPLAGTTVSLKSSHNSTITNAEGNFNVSLFLPADTLVVSHIGYETQYIVVSQAENSFLTILLNESTSRLQEVVVSTGYQKIPKERATGSFEQIDNEILNQQAGLNILDRLKGISTIRFDHNINRPSLTIRGLSSIIGPKDPLIVVDNFPYNGDIRNINPNDVESVTILKDAAAASIWGTRAGNGVIVITTKKGNFNQPLQISLNANITVTQKPDLFYLDQMSTSDFIDVEKFLFSKGYYNSQVANIYTHPTLTPVVELLYAAQNGKISEKEANRRIDALRDKDVRNDFDKYVYQPAVLQQYALSFNGGSNKATYILSGGYDRNVNELSGRYNRITLRSQNTFKPFRNFELTASLSYNQSDIYSGKRGYQSYTSLYPYAQLADDSGNALPLTRYRQTYIDTAGAGKLLDWNYYPLEDYKHNKEHTNEQYISANIGINYHILKGLQVELKYQYERQITQTDQLYDLESFYARDLINKFSVIDWNTGNVTYNLPKGSILDRSREILKTHNARLQLNYSNTWGKSNLTAIVGGEIREIKNRGNGYRTYGYNEDVLTFTNVDYKNLYPYYLTGFSAFIPDRSFETGKLNHYVSVYANAAYTYDRKYTLSASARRDASNMFGVNTNDKWQPLWSAGAAWNISNETFYKSSFLPFLKIRTTYGYSGNVDQSKTAITTLRYFGRDRYTNLNNATVLNLANPDLRWEKVRMLNIGVDFRMKKDILSGSIEYYRKRGTDLFGNTPVDYTATGRKYLKINVANMKGQGFDIKLMSKVIDHRSFKWNINLLFNYNKTKVTKYFLDGTRGANYISDGQTINPLEGKPVYSILSYQWAGLDSTGNPVGIVNGKKTTDYSTITGNETEVTDLVYAGPALPPVYGSLTSIISWKNISLTANIMYNLNYYFRRQSINYRNLLSNKYGHGDFSKRWQEPGDENTTSVPAMVYPAGYNRAAFYINSDLLVTRGDNIRLHYINLSYDMNKTVFKMLPFQKLNIYLIANDLGILWSANPYGIDPDYSTYKAVPPSKSFTAGIKIIF